jgi:hypothetical protein
VSTWLRQHAKALVAVATAILTALATIYGPDNQWVVIGLSAVGAFGVYFVENEQMPKHVGKHSEPVD